MDRVWKTLLTGTYLYNLYQGLNWKGFNLIPYSKALGTRSLSLLDMYAA